MSSKSKTALPAPAADTFEKVKRNAANNMESTMINAAEQFEKMSQDVLARFEDAAGASRGNLEAAIQAANIVAEGTKDIQRLVLAQAQQALEASLNASRALFGIKNVQDFAGLQSDYVKSSFDTLMAEATKISEVAVRCTSQAAEPINARINETVEKLGAQFKKAA